MKLKILKYPKIIYNEQELLDIYKKKFPQIVYEFEKLAEETYCNPLSYKKAIKKSSKKFDSQFEKMIEKSKKDENNLSTLIKISLELHKNYAFNFWLVSYVLGEGPLALHYVKLMEKILKKVYSKNEEMFQTARAAFLRTDFEIFYHKILMDSIKMADLLNKGKETKKLLLLAKQTLQEKRVPIYNKLIAELKKSKKTDPWLLHILKWHGNNKTPIYNLLNQGIDYYDENLNLKMQLKNTTKIIKQTFKFAKTKLNESDFIKLKNLYNLIKEMIKAKDFIFGRKDVKLFNFWNNLNQKIIKEYQKETGKEIILDNRSFISIPWILEKELPRLFFF